MKLEYDKYQTLFKSEDFRKIGDIKNRKCRFCDKDYLSTTFDNESHIIPRALGSNALIGYNECDACNDKYNKQIDTDFIQFLTFERALNLNTDNKKVKYKLAGHESYIKKCENTTITYAAFGENETIKAHEDIKYPGILFVSIRLLPVNLLNVCRAMARMSIFCLKDDDLKKNLYLYDIMEKRVKLPIKIYFNYFTFAINFKSAIHIITKINNEKKNETVIHFYYGKIMLTLPLDITNFNFNESLPALTLEEREIVPKMPSFKPIIIDVLKDEKENNLVITIPRKIQSVKRNIPIADIEL